MPTAESQWDPLFETLADSKCRIAMVVTGGGAGALARCFRRAGASKNFVDAAIPYSPSALVEYLGCRPVDASASPAVAKQLALAAMQRSARMGDDEDSREVVGLALTAALPTAPRRRGQDRIHVALCTHARGLLWSLELAKEAHTRESAETIADEMVYRALIELTKIPPNERFFADGGLNLVQTCFEIDAGLRQRGIRPAGQ